MLHFLHTLLALFAAVAPFGALPVFLAYQKRSDLGDARLLYLAPAVGFVVLAVVIIVADPILDLVDITGESFQIGAAVLMLPLAARLVLAGSSMPSPRDMDDVTKYAWLLPLGFPMLAGPPSIAAAISYAARFGEAQTIGATAIVCAFTAALVWAGPRIEPRLGATWIAVLAHATGVLLLAVAFEQAIDGIRSA